MLVVMLLVGRRSMEVIGSVAGVSCIPGSMLRMEKALFHLILLVALSGSPFYRGGERPAPRGNAPGLGLQSQPMAEQLPRP